MHAGNAARSSHDKAVRPSVRPSVRLSVKRVDCDKTEESSAQIVILFISVFWEEEWLVGARTLQTDRRQTDGRPMTYSEREREFTFAKNCIALSPSTSQQNSKWLVLLPSESQSSVRSIGIYSLLQIGGMSISMIFGMYTRKELHSVLYA